MTMFRFAAFAATGSGVLAALLASQSNRFKAYAASVQNIPTDETSYPSTWNSNWDKRSPLPGSKDEDKPTAKRTLVLIRHGQYETWHEDREKRVLTALGREQAKLTGLRLKELSPPDYSIMYCSSMPRARETANIIAEVLPNVPRRESDMFCEGAPIPPEPSSKHWRPEEYEFHRDGARIEAAFRHLFHRAKPSQKEDSVEIVVCHANVIRYFVMRALQLPPEAWLRMSLAHGSITKVVIRPTGSVHVTEIGNSGHFPPGKISFK